MFIETLSQGCHATPAGVVPYICTFICYTHLNPPDSKRIKFSAILRNDNDAVFVPLIQIYASINNSRFSSSK